MEDDADGSEAGSMGSEYILVSIIAAVDGAYRLPKVDGNASLKQGLVVLGGMGPVCSMLAYTTHSGGAAQAR